MCGGSSTTHLPHLPHFYATFRHVVVVVVGCGRYLPQLHAYSGAALRHVVVDVVGFDMCAYACDSVDDEKGAKEGGMGE